MSIADKIVSDLKDAMKSRDKVAVDALRLIKSDIGYLRIKKGVELDDKDLLALFVSIENKWTDARDQFAKGGRQDLAEKESGQLNVVRRYLPRKLTESELAKVIDAVLIEIGARSSEDLGKAMKAVMERVRGQADGAIVKEIVASKLSTA